MGKWIPPHLCYLFLLLHLLTFLTTMDMCLIPGITLSLDQWNMLRDNAEEIDKALGHS
ncbi:hypothetical protein OIU84_006483 [Salix udensis]|uniref:Uncharacterized protein n=1 Tax=Salix udensis TaxID=889485 RepID=A0AAD6K0F9_9ROSI|nr:hypothetical protein OIU84_006483 [Salix udensis]